jgi:cobalamin biosynthesis protein CobT
VDGKPEEIAAIESQAIGRAHRQGQKKQLTLIRLIIKNTIEHEIYERNSAVISQAKEAANQPSSPSSAPSSSSSSSAAMELEDEEEKEEEEEEEEEKEEKPRKEKEQEKKAPSSSSASSDEEEVEEKEPKKNTMMKMVKDDDEEDEDDEEEEEEKSDGRVKLDLDNLRSYTMDVLRAFCRREGVRGFGRTKATATRAIHRHFGVVPR